jgi:hypothetical protein
MSDVKALFPIGKTQWRKWRAEQRIAFNETRAAGVPFNDAVKYVNELELVEVKIAPPPPPAPPKKKNVLDITEDVAEVAVALSGVTGATGVAIDGVKKTVKAVKGKKAK